MGSITVERYVCGQPHTEASRALTAWLDATDTDRSYLPMMRHRVAGRAADQCEDTYYIAMENANVLSRLWNGWGKHPDAIGNFGNFLTVEQYQGRGIGRKLLDAWYEDLVQRKDRPLGLFCNAKNGFLIDMYGRYGFTQAVTKPSYSLLYKPLDGSCSDFGGFCENYYCSAKTLAVRPATVGWRHEIDCLLKFTLASMEKPLVYPVAKAWRKPLCGLRSVMPGSYLRNRIVRLAGPLPAQMG